MSGRRTLDRLRAGYVEHRALIGRFVFELVIFVVSGRSSKVLAMFLRAC